MALLPKVKLKVVPTFPSNIIGGIGIETTKEHGHVTIDMAWNEFGLQSSIPTSPTNNVLTFDTATEQYVMIPSSLLGGAVAGIAEAPNDGVQYGRQSTAWTPVVTGSSFIQAGTGAVTRTMQDKVRESISVKDFGAVGNGVVNDTNAIQNAIYAAGPTNAEVYFPAGNYKAVGLFVTPVNTAGVITGAVSFRGDGARASRITRPAGVAGHIVVFGFIDQNVTTGTSFRPEQPRITGLGFYSDNTTPPGGGSTSLVFPAGPNPSTDYGYGPWLEDVIVDGSPDYGIFIGQNRNFAYMSRVVGLFTSKHALYIFGSGDHTIVQSNFGSTATASYDAVMITNVFSLKCFGCDFQQGNAAAGVCIQGAFTFAGFHECVFNGNWHEGIRIFGDNSGNDLPVVLHSCLFEKNSLESNAGFPHILISQRGNVTVTNCKFFAAVALPPAENPAGAPVLRTPNYAVLTNGVTGDIRFDNNTLAASGVYTVSLTNTPLRLTNCGQASVIPLTPANLTPSGGSITTASGTLTQLRQGRTITVTASWGITTDSNTTGAALNLRFPVEVAAVRDHHGVGELNGGAPLQIQIANAATLITARLLCYNGTSTFTTAGVFFGYPGGNGTSGTLSLSYLI